MSPSLLIWGGPVQASDIKAVRWMSPVSVLVISRGPDGGFGSSSFSQLAASCKDKDGHILPTLLARNHLSADMFGRIAIAGFSAFHGLASPLLLADGDAIDAAILNDACFSSYDHLAKSGYVSYGERAALGEKLMVMTASAGGGKSVGYSTGYECANASFNGAASAAGVQPELYNPPLPLPSPQSGIGKRAGDLFYLDYHSDYSHGDHVHKLAVPVLDIFLAPYLARAPGAFGPLHVGGPPFRVSSGEIAAGLGLITLVGGLAYAARKRSWPFS